MAPPKKNYTFTFQEVETLIILFRELPLYMGLSDALGEPQALAKLTEALVVGETITLEDYTNDNDL